MRRWNVMGWAGVALLGLAMALPGCSARRANTATTFVDKNPLPADTMTFETDEIGTYGGRFVIGQTIGPKTFNPNMANETSSTDLTNLMYCALADFNNATQQDTPNLAKSWETSPDGLTWTFHLRHGAAFSDGHPITSADVLFNFETCYDDSLHPSVQDLLKVDGKPFDVSAPDSYTVVIRSAKQYALLVPAVASMKLVPKHMLEDAYRKGTFASAYGVSSDPKAIVTSGAWRLKQYVPGEKTVVERNPYWFGVDAAGHRLPYLDEVVFVIVPDQNTAALKFQAGDLDGLDNVKPEDYKQFTEGQQKGQYTLHDVGPALNTNFFWFNLNRVRDTRGGKKLGALQVDPIKYAWFNNRTFRLAVSHAIDRDAIIKGPYYGDAVKNWSTSTPANKLWYTPETPAPDYNLEESKRLLASLGWKDGNGDGYLEDTKGHTIEFTLKTNADNLVRMAMGNFIKDDLAKVGIKVTLAGVDFNTLITNLRQDFNYEAVLLGLQSAVPPDPGMGQNVWRSSGLTHYWNIKQPRPETPTEAKIDALIEANVLTTDYAERRRTWAEIQRLVNEECFMEWLPTQIMKLPVRNRFGNTHPTVIPHRLLWNIDRVFLKKNAASRT